VLAGYDGLFVGGASEASVLEPENYPFVSDSIALMQYCLASDVPVFASCFGFQLAVLALGGRIVRDTADYEMGTPPIRLTGAGHDDLLFHDTPSPFRAVSETDACPHAFKVEDRRFWAFQFHPEVDRATLVERLTHYKASYTSGDEHLQQVLDTAAETPESNELVQKFVQRVLLA